MDEGTQQADAQFLAGVLASSNDCIKLLDLDGNLTFMSEGGRRVMEVSDFDVIRGCAWPDFWQGPGRAEARAALEAAKAGGVGHFQGPADTMAGNARYWDVRVTVIMGADGRPERLLSISRDITAAWRGEQALREARSLNALILGSSRDCIVVLDLGGHTLFVSPGGIESMEISSVEAIIGLSWLRVWKGADHEAAAAAVAAARAGGTGRFEGFCPTHRGTPKWWDVVVSPLAGADGRPERLVSVGRDITERRQAEQRLRELNDTLERRVVQRTAERNLYAEIVETTDMMFMAVDLDHRILAINRANADEFERIYGVRPKVGDDMLELLADQPEQRMQVKAGWARGLGGEEVTFVEAFGASDRVHPCYEVRFRPLRNEAGERIGCYQFVTDVTERLREQAKLAEAQEALRQSQKMEAVGQLTGGLAHDFNNLLTGISGSLDLLGKRVAQGRVNDLDRYIQAAQGASKRAAALTHRLLAFSRRQTLDPRPTDVSRLVTGMADLIRRTVGPEIAVETVDAVDLWTALVDPNQLENALLNLCINARDAMPDGGRLVIETVNTWMDDRAARERDVPPGPYLSIRVSDTGTGMPEEVIARAFDPFFTTKPIGQGTGLGLSMIYGFARQSGGQVRIASEVGRGTAISIDLPRHDGAEETAGTPADRADAPRAEAGETVLVVDDEAAIRMLIGDVLSDLGYAAIEAEDGSSGLKVLQGKARVDLLVTDVGLPGGMNGRQVADAARVLRPGLKVLFITGYAENAAVGSGDLDPGMAVLTKPFAMDDLGARIRALIEG